MDSILYKDINSLIENEIELLSELRGSRILVTGATGLIGSALIYTLCEYNKREAADICILALSRNKEKASAMFSGYDNVEPITQDICDELCINTPIDYIVHGASATSSRYFVDKPVETIKTALSGTENVLKLAVKNLSGNAGDGKDNTVDKTNEHRLKALLYLSSLEVYGSFDSEELLDIDESSYGTIDPLSVRSSYSEGKRLCETLCASYHSEYGVPAKVARLTQTFGAGVSYNDGRVFAEFARCAIEGRDIVLHTKGETVRDYCYITDAVRAIIYILLRGKAGEAYNVANEETTVSIYDMAVLCADLSKELYGKSIDVIIKDDANASMGYNPIVRLRLNSQKLQDLGWSAKIGLRDMFVKTIGSMSSLA